MASELPEGHVALGQVLIFLRQYEGAIAAVERAIILNPNLTSFRFAYTYILAGEAARAAHLLQAHMRLDPFYEPNAPMALGFAFYMLKRYEEAVVLLQQAVSRAPEMAHGLYVLAMTYAKLGEMDKAKSVVNQVEAVRACADHVAAEMDAIAYLHPVGISICRKVYWEEVHLDSGVRSNNAVLAVPPNDFAPHFCNLGCRHGFDKRNMIMLRDVASQDYKGFPLGCMQQTDGRAAGVALK